MSKPYLKIAAVSDLHGNLVPVHNILELEKPDLLLCVGDWGTAEEVTSSDLDSIIKKVYTLTVFGNNDPVDLLPAVPNQDGGSILLENGLIEHYFGLSIAGINGIWAKSHKKPWYITDDEVAAIAAKLADKDVDILMTHGCPIGMADLTPFGTHGGQRCFTEAFKIVKPKLHLCGHLHRKSSYQTKDGKLIVNIGITSEGDYAIFHFENGNVRFESKVI
ncbi:MAG: metallophosphoesterase family protein [bacterium]